jgi:hypothetical protein
MRAFADSLVIVISEFIRQQGANYDALSYMDLESKKTNFVRCAKSLNLLVGRVCLEHNDDKFLSYQSGSLFMKNLQQCMVCAGANIEKKPTFTDSLHF